MSDLTDLKPRGVKDILITATDYLNGFTQTMRSVFPESQTKYVWFIKLGMHVNTLFGKTESNLLPI